MSYKIRYVYCPFCKSKESQVVDSRISKEGDHIRRRRECSKCGKRFTTYEHYERRPVAVLKNDGSTQPFDREKLLRGLVRATNKRPVTVDQLEELVDRIEAEIRSDNNEVPAARIGELVLLSLKDLDQVAYVRFASVYREFESANDFAAELERLSLGSGASRK